MDLESFYEALTVKLHDIGLCVRYSEVTSQIDYTSADLFGRDEPTVPLLRAIRDRLHISSRIFGGYDVCHLAVERAVNEAWGGRNGSWLMETGRMDYSGFTQGIATVHHDLDVHFDLISS